MADAGGLDLIGYAILTLLSGSCCETEIARKNAHARARKPPDATDRTPRRCPAACILSEIATGRNGPAPAKKYTVPKPHLVPGVSPHRSPLVRPLRTITDTSPAPTGHHPLAPYLLHSTPSGEGEAFEEGSCFLEEREPSTLSINQEQRLAKPLYLQSRERRQRRPSITLRRAPCLGAGR